MPPGAALPIHQLETIKKLGLIAGNGKFPLIFAAEANREGYFVVAVAHRGETDQAIERVADEVDLDLRRPVGKDH